MYFVEFALCLRPEEIAVTTRFTAGNRALREWYTMQYVYLWVLVVDMLLIIVLSKWKLSMLWLWIVPITIIIFAFAVHGIPYCMNGIAVCPPHTGPAIVVAQILTTLTFLFIFFWTRGCFLCAEPREKGGCRQHAVKGAVALAQKGVGGSVRGICSAGEGAAERSARRHPHRPRKPRGVALLEPHRFPCCRFPCLCAPEVPGWVFWPPDDPPSNPMQGDIDVAGFVLLLDKASRGFPPVEDCQWTPPARPFMQPGWLP